MSLADIVTDVAPAAGSPKKIGGASGADDAAEKARVALSRTGIKDGNQGKSKSGFLQKRGPLKVRRCAWLLLRRMLARSLAACPSVQRLHSNPRTCCPP
jgi:hypothetical protein